jgi:V-type H+-transporting ATPase subunit C
MEYWIVSAPGRPTPEKSFEELTAQLGAHASCQKFNIPDLKVGTLDSLVATSDQLAKLDPFVESVVRKIVKYIYDIVDVDDRPNLHDNLVIGQHKLPTDVYVSRFQWDMARYPNKQPVPNIVDMIAKIINDIDGEYKRKTTAYNNARSQALALERKAA